MRHDKDFYEKINHYILMFEVNHITRNRKTCSELNACDTVYVAPEIKHWHGAAPESYFVHIAESVPNENASNQWLEAVDGEEYLKLK